MDDKTIQIIKERFDSLPESIQELIMSDEYQNNLIEIGKKYQLNIEQLGIIEREVTMVLMGLTNSKDFEGELTGGLRVDKEKGRGIAQDVSDKVFTRVRELLQLMNTPLGEEPIVEEKGEDAMKSAGIDVIPQKPKVEFQTDVTKNDREEMLKKIENPDLIHGPKELEAPHQIHQQKLAGSFQIPKTETHYEENKGSQKPGSDPYREPVK